MKKFDIFRILAQNIDCGYSLEPPRRGGSQTSTHNLFWSKNKKNMYTPAYPNFSILKWGLRGYTLHGHVFLMPRNVNLLFICNFQATFHTHDSVTLQHFHPSKFMCKQNWHWCHELYKLCR